MGKWIQTFDPPSEESIDVVIQVCWSYIRYLQDPDFQDMLSSDAKDNVYRYSEEGAAEPTHRAILYRLPLYLAAVLHNPSSRIMKPRLKRLFKTIEEYYGDYTAGLKNNHYKLVKQYIESL